MSLLNNKYISIYRDIDLEAFYDIAPKYRRKIILAHILIHLLPVMIVGLLAWNVISAPVSYYVMGFALFLYVVVIIETISYLYPNSRKLYKRYLLLVMIPLGLLSGIVGFYVGSNVMAEGVVMEGNHWAGFGILAASIFGTVGVFFWTHFGISQILHASRELFTRKADIEADVRFAAEVQNRILKEVSIMEGPVRAYACSHPANELGGDFFELVRRNGSLYAAVGDISGHSFGAGLLMTMMKSALQTHIEYHHDPTHIIQALNRIMMSQSDRGMFATMSLMQLDPDRRMVKLCNAGHLPVYHLVKKSGELKHRHRKGMGLGIHHKAEYSNLEFPVASGDMLLLYSDGVIETRDEQMQVRDATHFEQIVSEMVPWDSESPKAMATAILAEVRRTDHAETREDDATLVLLEIR